MRVEAEPILHDAPPNAPRTERLPGTGPVGPHDWVLRCEAFARQMALRDRLVVERAGEVLALRREAREPAAELLDAVVERVGRDRAYALESGPGGAGDARGLPRREGPRAVTGVWRPDGARVPIDRARPMATIARLIQEDVCLLQPGPSGHVLTAGALLFPSFWRLGEKLGRSLISIHAPVEEYDEGVARRVQRLFDALRPGVVLCRWNWLPYDEPWLHQPRDEAVRREATAASPYLRRERQCLLRLPRTGAVAFTIHTLRPARGASRGAGHGVGRPDVMSSATAMPWGRATRRSARCCCPRWAMGCSRCCCPTATASRPWRAWPRARRSTSGASRPFA